MKQRGSEVQKKRKGRDFFFFKSQKKQGFGRDGREKKMDGGIDRGGQIEGGKKKVKKGEKGKGVMEKNRVIETEWD